MMRFALPIALCGLCGCLTPPQKAIPQNTTVTAEHADVKTETTAYTMDAETRKMVGSTISKIMWGAGIVVLLCIAIVVFILHGLKASIPASIAGRMIR